MLKLKSIAVVTAVSLTLAAAYPPTPAQAGGNGAGIALGIIGGIIAGAVAANANRPPQPYYPQQPAYASNSAACQSWLAVLNNPRYDATTRAQAQQIVSECGLPYSVGGDPALAPSYAQTPAPSYAPTPTPTYAPASVSHAHEIALTKSNNHYYVNGIVNGIPIDFELDTGASNTSLSYAATNRLGLGKKDVIKAVPVQGVNGLSNEPLVQLRDVNIGGYVLPNARALVGNYTLLGQDFLSRLGTYTIDNHRGVLVLNG
jgi:clan AA aspartic protease (TIGR02281 family)